MPDDLMVRCEEKREFRVEGGTEWRWKDVPVSQVIGADRSTIRCMHCHGAVRVHRQQVTHGPQDHVEHLLRQDSEGCKGGHHFDGKHRPSSQPVL
jgi:hypothetical protein